MPQLLADLFYRRFLRKPDTITELPPSGSYRRYFRLESDSFSVIGVVNKDKKENKAFVEFSKHFYSNGLNVPEILVEDLDNYRYLQTDLGNRCLWDEIIQDNKMYSENLIGIYKKVIKALVDIQIKGGEGLDYSLCIPRDAFDRQSIMWDLNYYKYCWLRLAKVFLEEQKLEDDFNKLADYLLDTNTDFFLFRDFQCRNIMIVEGEPFFIDYQGGRKGALQYDIASLLYDAIAEIPEDKRVELLNYYLDCVQDYLSIDREDFVKRYYAYAFIRLLQAMGAFGLRGLHENKQHFIDSIAPGLRNLSVLKSRLEKYIDLPELYVTIDRGMELYVNK
jgi:aminoglycoside/choline kinase family phosphotransferase